MMIKGSLGWKVLKMPFILLAFVISLRRFNNLREYSDDKRKSLYDLTYVSNGKIAFLVHEQGYIGFIPCLQDGLLFQKDITHSDYK